MRNTDAYQKECAKWEKDFGEQTTPKAETMHEKLQRYQEKIFLFPLDSDVTS